MSIDINEITEKAEKKITHYMELSAEQKMHSWREAYLDRAHGVYMLWSALVGELVTSEVANKMRELTKE